ncbi:MAG: hypothetical protein Hens2KO_09670 [Henriciella sp.]
MTFSGDARLRYDVIDQADIPNTGEALTLSARIAAEWTPHKTISVLAEVEGVGALIDDFNETPMPPRDFPFLPDPDHIDLNRLQLQAKLSEQAFLTIGRQNLRIDDQRFLGMAPFRQNRRSYDAARLSLRTDTAHTFQVGHIGKVNRPLGNRTPLGEFDSDSWFGNANFQTPFGRIGVFHYALDLETGANWNRNKTLASATSGIRFDGRYHSGPIKFDVEASYAEQTDYGDNPLSYAADYHLMDVRAFLGAFEVAVRYEALGGDDQQSFQTPLASLHKFQGAADVFLSTPADGLVDYSAQLKFNGGTIGPFTDITPKLALHHFEADRGGANYGTEIDIVIGAKLADLKLTLGLADYHADTFSADRQRLFLAIGKQF